MVESSPFADDHLQKAYKSVFLMKFGFSLILHFFYGFN